MRFLKTLFWILLAVVVTLFAANNWRDVSIDLWGNLRADVKLPVLLLLVFIAAFVPTWLVYRARLWRAQNRAFQQREPVIETEPDMEPVE